MDIFWKFTNKQAYALALKVIWFTFKGGKHTIFIFDSFIMGVKIRKDNLFSFGLGFKAVQDDFRHDSTRIADEVLVLQCWQSCRLHFQGSVIISIYVHGVSHSRSPDYVRCFVVNTSIMVTSSFFDQFLHVYCHVQMLVHNQNLKELLQEQRNHSTKGTRKLYKL